MKDFIKIIGEKIILRDVVDWPQSQPPGGYDNLANYIGSESILENDGYVYQKYNAVVNALFWMFSHGKIYDLDEVEDALLFKNIMKGLKFNTLKLFQDP